MFFISAKNAQNYKELMKNLVTRDEIENKIKIPLHVKIKQIAENKNWGGNRKSLKKRTFNDE